MRELVVGVEVGRAVVALEHGDRAAGLEHLLQREQGLDGAREVLQHEADEHVVERRRREGQGEDVLLPELHVGQAGGGDPAFCFFQRNL